MQKSFGASQQRVQMEQRRPSAFVDGRLADVQLGGDTGFRAAWRSNFSCRVFRMFLSPSWNSPTKGENSELNFNLI
ncbi:MAG TPA: hypothetical protein VGF13_10855 [Verrucomicrobiae bacterium]